MPSPARVAAGQLLPGPSPVSTAPSLAIPLDAAFDCTSCGACCSYSSDWPRFSTEDDAQLDRIPAKLVATSETGMRCDGARCSALAGTVGQATSCTIYEIRPDVCRACMPGDGDCRMARKAFGLPV